MCIRKIRAGVIDGDTVVVSSPEVTEAKNVRYAYRALRASVPTRRALRVFGLRRRRGS